MKRLVIVAMTVVVTASVLACSATQQRVTSSPSSEAGNDLAADVLKVDGEFQRAKLANDVTTLERILDDDYVGTNQNGNTRNKQQCLELWASFPISSLVTESATVSFSEENRIAVVSGEQTEVNATGTDAMRFKRVYVRTPTGEWRLRSATQARR